MSQLKRYNGSSWEKVSGGLNIVQGGLAGQLLQEITLTADSSTVNFTGLNSVIDGDYTLEFNLTSTVTNGAIYIGVNGDTTLTNYWAQSFDVSSNNPTTQARNNFPMLSYIGSTVGQSFGSCKITISNGHARILSDYGYNALTVPSRSSQYIIHNPTITTISSLNIFSAITNGIGIGSTFRLYGSKIATKLISYDPLNFTGLTGDRLLRVGEVAYINYTNAMSVPLNIKTEEGLYELCLMSDISTAQTNINDILLLPNNNLVSNISRDAIYRSGSTTVSNYEVGSLSSFILAAGVVVMHEGKISTITKSKSVQSHMNGLFANIIRQNLESQYWNDTTTPWTSLGTITFPFAQSGKIVIRRIL